MAQDMSQFTDQWMTNPYMFDPTQLSNQFSNYNNAALPWPPTYNTGAGGPVNAATGQPIQSFQQWQQANPGGTTLNATPAQPQAAPPPTPQGVTQYNSTGQFGQQAVPYQAPGGQVANPGFTAGGLTSGAGLNPAAAPQQSGGGAPNNWQAAINALANPGRVQTMGANVPQVTGYQPSGGVNQAFLGQAGAGQGMNQNYLSALRAIQGRPQG